MWFKKKVTEPTVMELNEKLWELHKQFDDLVAEGDALFESMGVEKNDGQ